MKRWQTLFLLLFSSHVQLWSQSAPLERIGIEQGLSQGFVTCLAQDREGFIWAGTMNGLNRYDGQRMKVFVSDPHDSLSLSSSAIGGIHDFGDCLLVGTYGTGLNIFCKKSQRFFRLPYRLSSQANLPTDKTYTGNSLPAENVFNELIVDADGHIWLLNYNGVFSQKAWVVRMEVPKGFWEELPSDPSLVSKIQYRAWYMDNLESNWPQFIVVNERQIICFRKDQTLVFNHQEQNWVTLKLKGGPPQKLAHIVFAEDKRTSLLQSADSLAWHCTGDDCRLLGKLPGMVFFFNDKKVWLRQDGWYKTYPIANSLETVDWAGPALSVPRKDVRWMAMFDRSGNLWFPERISGLAKYSTINGRFRHYFQGQSLMTCPFNSQNDGFGYLKDARIKLNSKPDPLLEAIQRMLDRESLSSFMINHDAAGNYWMVIYQTGLKHHFVVKADKLTGQVKRWKSPMASDAAYFSTFDEMGRYWYTTGGRLACFDPNLPETANDEQRWAFFDFGALGTADDQIIGMAKTADGSWWMASMKGLIRAKPNRSEAGKPRFDFQMLTTKANVENSPRSNNVACLLTDPKDANLLWIGSKGGGLSRLDTRTGHFKHLTTRNGLPNDVIYGILPDDEGRLWLSSNRGLIRYNPVTGEIKTFRQADGLQSDEFNSHAYSKTLSGELMFGGVNGLNVFDPKDLVDNKAKPKVLLTGLRINNLPVSVRDGDGILKESIEFCKEIVLPFSKHNITFEFAALEFTAPTKNKFRYYLKGAEKEWEQEGSEPHATYLNLPPGDYTFIVNGSNNDGVWSDEPVRLRITILAPWYRTWLAYLAYLLVLGGLAYWLVRDWMKKRDLRQTLELKEKEALHVGEMNQLKLDEFTQRILEKSQLIAELEGRLESEREVENEMEQENEPEPAIGHTAKPDDLHKLYKSQILTAKDWESFKTLFDRVHPGYMPQVMHRYPQLTPAESRLVMLTKMGLNTAEIAAMIGVSSETVKKTRQRLRKKLEPSNANLDDLVALL
ncbi:MAG: hypothetical protein IPN76_32460 [Saprospiraceae bacterium]|nr:hypothetical protein [Saprospiraceae bacterium]